MITTGLYGGTWGLWVFLAARMGWGIAWSALRQGGYQAIWASGESGKGKLMGLLWGVIRLGSAFSVLLGGFLRDRWGYRAGLFGIMGISALAAPLTLSIRWPAESQRLVCFQAVSWLGWREALNAPQRRRLLFAGSVHSGFEGILIATASLFIARRLGAANFCPGRESRLGPLPAFSWRFAGRRTSFSPRGSAGYPTALGSGFPWGSSFQSCRSPSSGWSMLGGRFWSFVWAFCSSAAPVSTWS